MVMHAMEFVPGIERALTDRDIRRRAEALGDGDTPTEWTPEHVGARLIEAFDILGRSGVRAGPGRVGNGWPAMVQEFADMVDAQARMLAEKEKQQARSSRPTSDEVSRMNEALAWPMAFLDRKPLPADSLTLWAYAKATGRDMDGMLHHRRKRAVALAEEAMRRANGPPHMHEGKVKDTRSVKVLDANALRAYLARETAADVNAALARAPIHRHAELRKQAIAAFRARCREHGCLPLVVRPHQAMPGRALTRTWLDHNRKIGMRIIADALRSAGVPVR